MDVLTDVLDRVRLKGTVLFHYELGRPWSVSLPKFPDAVFHYLSRGSASLALEDGRTVRMSAGDFVIVSRGEPHLLSCGRGAKPFPLLDLDRRPAHLGPVRHGGREGPISTMICGLFSLSRPLAYRRSGSTSAASALEAVERRLARAAPAAHSRRVRSSASRAAGRSLADDRSALRRGAAQLDQNPRSR